MASAGLRPCGISSVGVPGGPDDSAAADKLRLSPTLQTASHQTSAEGKVVEFPIKHATRNSLDDQIREEKLNSLRQQTQGTSHEADKLLGRLCALELEVRNFQGEGAPEDTEALVQMLDRERHEMENRVLVVMQDLLNMRDSHCIAAARFETAEAHAQGELRAHQLQAQMLCGRSVALCRKKEAATQKLERDMAKAEALSVASKEAVAMALAAPNPAPVVKVARHEEGLAALDLAETRCVAARVELRDAEMKEVLKRNEACLVQWTKRVSSASSGKEDPQVSRANAALSVSKTRAAAACTRRAQLVSALEASRELLQACRTTVNELESKGHQAAERRATAETEASEWGARLKSAAHRLRGETTTLERESCKARRALYHCQAAVGLVVAAVACAVLQARAL